MLMPEELGFLKYLKQAKVRRACVCVWPCAVVIGSALACVPVACALWVSPASAARAWARRVAPRSGAGALRRCWQRTHLAPHRRCCCSLRDNQSAKHAHAHVPHPAPTHTHATWQVSLNEYEFPSNKLASVQSQLERLVEKNYYLHQSARDAYRCVRACLRACVCVCVRVCVCVCGCACSQCRGCVRDVFAATLACAAGCQYACTGRVCQPACSPWPQQTDAGEASSAATLCALTCTHIYTHNAHTRNTHTRDAHTQVIHPGVQQPRAEGHLQRAHAGPASEWGRV
jgi:hypothetical protein